MKNQKQTSTQTATQTATTYPEYYTWQEVAAIIRQNSFNGVKAFALRHNIQPLKPTKRVLFEKSGIHHAISQSEIALGL